MKKFFNPILPGFYPDPSVCRVDDDYYLATSSFAYYPGVPIFHSRDLVNWKQIGHILERESQLNLLGATYSGGIYAPTLRYHEGTFYMITTNVSGEGNFYVTSNTPEGPWSDPIVLDAHGIDPSLFFDGDGKAYYVGTREKPKSVSRYYGDNEIWLQELELKSGKLVGEQFVLWEGALVDAVWPEAPHIYKEDGYYYLMIAEGGTSYNHAVTIARSKSIIGPYESNPNNPILTHRHLGKNYPIINVGHGDLVEVQDGSWWMVLLGCRVYEGHHGNLGRETFLVPVEWENDWPIVNPGIGLVEDTGVAPALPEFYITPEDSCDHFDGEELDNKWVSLRGPKEAFCSLSERPGYLRLRLQKTTIRELLSPSLIVRRQQHINFIASTIMEFSPKSKEESAGLILIQSDKYHFRYEYTIEDATKILRLIKCESGKEEIICEKLFNSTRIYMKVVGKGQKLNFYYGKHQGDIHTLIENVDATILSVDKAGGFVGTCLGMYATSNGIKSDNHADFNWFEYKGEK